MAKKSIPLENSEAIRRKWVNLRKKRKLTHKTVAEKLGVSATLVGDWERGRLEPPLQALINLAEIYNVTLDFLVDRRDLENKHWLQALAPLRLLLDQLDEAGAATLAKAVEICLEMKGLKKEEPQSSPKETNPIARRGRRATGGV